MDKINKALEIAINAHNGQVDKGGHDYIYHPITVALHCDTENEIVVALLHDVVEDTDVTIEGLQCFGAEIVEAVNAITKKENQSLNEYLNCVKANEIARKVKIQDIMHNMDVSRLREVTEMDIKRIDKYKQELEFLKDN